MTKSEEKELREILKARASETSQDWSAYRVDGAQDLTVHIQPTRWGHAGSRFTHVMTVSPDGSVERETDQEVPPPVATGTTPDVGDRAWKIGRTVRVQTPTGKVVEDRVTKVTARQVRTKKNGKFKGSDGSGWSGNDNIIL